MSLKRLSGTLISISVILASVVQPSTSAATTTFASRAMAPVNVGYASWSPDSEYIYFTYTYGDGEPRVGRQKVTSRRIEQIGSGNSPAVSPDGSKMVSWLHVGSGDLIAGTLYDVPSGTEISDLSNLTGTACQQSFAWSANGRNLYFIAGDLPEVDGFCVHNDIYSYDFSTHETRRITHGFGVSNTLTLNQDETKLFGYSFNLASGLSVDIASGNMTPSIACPNGAPFPLPNSTRILCSNLQPSQSVYLVNADGSGKEMVASTGFPVSGPVSPDGKYFAVSQSISGAPRFTLFSLTGNFPKWDWNAFDGFSINNAAVATNSTHVTLEFRPPLGATEILVSNDGGFSDAQDFPVETTSVEWELSTGGPASSTRVVYVRFGTNELWTDSIILDKTAPVATEFKLLSAKTVGTSDALRMQSSITEKGSGVVTIQYSDTSTSKNLHSKKVNFAPAKQKKKFTFAVTVSKNKKKYYFRFRDAAGNWSKWSTVKR